MKELWDKTFQLFRVHLILWIPSVCVGLLKLVLDWLRREFAFGLAQRLFVHHSALGGEYASSDPTEFQRTALRISMVLEPFNGLLDAFLFVIALVVTAKLVRMILDGKEPELLPALKEVVPEWRRIARFSFQCFLALAAFGAVMLLSTMSAMISLRLLAFFASKAVTYPIAIALKGGAAWLLMPAAMRLLQMSDASPVTTQNRKLGTVSVVLTSAATLVLGILVARAEAGLRLDNQSELWAVSAANSIVENAPTVFQFIALALLAFGSSHGAEGYPSLEPETPSPEIATDDTPS
jgi:hypothetical protein